ncbi:MAG: carotenoid oxygenase family protein [Gammaproteobacteria bacterium]|nr:carotenoid oxygenase family protein [Gammaproteobacteria bacterium]MCP5198956.1 carotenoid oxygenase family protein [Gammaproteobacteria bacterium]
MDAKVSTLADTALAGLERLGQSAAECEFEPAVEGRLPPDLRGTLYRNGPGLFERGGARKRHLLDGDGYVQALALGDGAPRYRARFVATDKYRAEQAAGRYLYPTWSTRVPGNWLRNVGNRIRTQAGVAVVMRGGRLLAFDDAGQPWELDPDNLATLGEAVLDGSVRLPSYNAHSRIDGRNGDWILFGQTYGRHTTAHVAVVPRDGRGAVRYSVALGRSTYLHDFFVSGRHVVFLVHALDFAPFGMLAGLRSFIDSLSWQPRLGNLAIVVERASGREVGRFEAPPAFMWHALNAYDEGDAIVADFVGYDEPDHFIGDDAEFFAVMQGRQGVAAAPGTLRRYRIDLARRRLDETTLAGGYHEFPLTVPGANCQRHAVGYFTHGTRAGTNLHSAVRAIDFEHERDDCFDFGPHCHVGEAVPAGERAGRAAWLLCLVLDGAAGRTHVAVLDAARLADGPVARLDLGHAVPLSFHGCWRPA